MSSIPRHEREQNPTFAHSFQLRRHVPYNVFGRLTVVPAPNQLHNEFVESESI